MLSNLLRISFLFFVFSQLTWAAVPDSGDTHEYQLSNGLKLIVREDHRAPTVAHMAWYRAGSMDEVNGKTGVAHVLEHMMFKGTDKVKAGEFSRLVAAVGGRENAFTSRGYTAYFQQIEKSKLEDVIKLEADRMSNLNFDDAEFLKEIQVIMEERRLRTEDNPSSLLNESLMATAYMSSPYRHPVIGWMNDLENMKASDARDWYRSWYKPNNATVVISGDVDAKKVLNMAEKYYGAASAHELPVRKPQIEPPQKGIKQVQVKAPADSAQLAMAWKVPRLEPGKLDDPEPYALELLTAVLDGYDNARLNRTLVKQEKVVNDVGVGYDMISRGPELFLISATMAKGKTVDQAQASIRKALDELKQKGILESELKRIKVRILSEQIYKRDSIFGQAMEIGSTEMAGFSWKDIDYMLEKMQSITPAQVQAVAKKYLVDEGLTIAVLDPQVRQAAGKEGK
ncbi:MULTISPECIES: pitrilysin family protein [unclassified Polynucleobacter]|jgi:zinc protease|uniref:M16 family metallopeptidase n=1 Tax=unclassified Polynucleobacter TaxID=2640945 RepID=UPI001C0BC586|nr:MULTISPECIES: pitrilysin family protein [unclassified Polynucleobacter]MBU3604657.1 insulinase family protein [Polynucleobacter sp. AP-Kaivos-20-H2]MBU3618400.1 insulinase family protein [Polynucleobacter sp. JS-Fieb-80-E5]